MVPALPWVWDPVTTPNTTIRFLERLEVTRYRFRTLKSRTFMQTLHTLKLNAPVTDLASGVVGVLTHLHVELDTSQRYLFKPSGLNPEDGQPVKGTWVTPDRIERQDGLSVVMPLPLNVLGTEVTHSNSGFKGMAIALIVHINGCVHVEVQPKGRIAKTNGMISPADFDIRALKGQFIPVLTAPELAESQAATPSPEPMESPRRAE